VLHLMAAEMGPRALMGLLESPRLRRLTSLRLTCARMDAGALRFLEEWPGLPRLRELWIRPEPLGATDPLPLRLAGLSPLALLNVLAPVREEDQQRLLARHGCRWWPHG
jgi:hypothetical protein